MTVVEPSSVERLKRQKKNKFKFEDGLDLGKKQELQFIKKQKKVEK